MQPPPLPPRFAPPPPFYTRPPASKRSRVVWALGAALLLLVITGAAVVLVQVRARNQLPPVTHETTAEKYAEASAAYTHPDFNAADPINKSIRATFDQIGRSRASRNISDLVNSCDFDRQLSESERSGLMGPVTPQFRAGLVIGMRQGATAAYTRLAPLLAWRRYEICHARFLRGNREAVVYTQEWRKSGIDAKMRYWIRREGSSWKIYDTEELVSGDRDSTIMALVVGRSSGGVLPQWVAGRRAINTANELLLDGKVTQAATTLKSVDSISLPPQVEVGRLVLRAALALHEFRYPEMLAALDSADALHVECPLIDQLRATAFNRLGRYDEARASIQKFLGEVGDGAEAELQTGNALAGLKRPTEAAEAYRKGLDLDPDAFENLRGLRRVLSPEQRRHEMGVRLAHCANPSTAYSNVAADAMRASDADSLEPLVDAYRQTNPDDVLLEYYQAGVLAMKHQYRQAADILRANYSRAKASDRGPFSREFVRDMIGAGDPIGAYRNSPESAAAFRQVATALLGSNDAGNLRKLLDQRQLDYPSDYWIQYYNGQLLQRSKQYARAADEYFKALEGAGTGPDVPTMRYAALNASVLAGKGMDAFRRLPTAEAFSILAYRFSTDNDTHSLERLVSERQKQAELGDVDVEFWRSRLDYLKGDFRAAISRLAALRLELMQNSPDHPRVSDLLVRCIVRTGNYDGAAHEAALLYPKGVPPMLTAIIEAGRGNVPAASAAIDTLLADEEDYDLATMYNDPELAPALRSPPWADWRRTHPEPPPTTRPAMSPATHSSQANPPQTHN